VLAFSVCYDEHIRKELANFDEEIHVFSIAYCVDSNALHFHVHQKIKKNHPGFPRWLFSLG
jgi:hypothetical protein